MPITVLSLSKPQKIPAWQEVPASLAGAHGKISQGLYVFLFRNGTDDQVLDNNKKKKVVVQPRGVSLKPGKFEQTFLTRLANYNSHLHRTRTEQPFEPAFWDCFAVGHVLDLSRADGLPAARIFERYWIEATNHFLASNGLLEEKQIGRSEWRYLRPGVWAGDVPARFLTYLQEAAERVGSMLLAGKFPSAAP